MIAIGNELRGGITSSFVFVFAVSFKWGFEQADFVHILFNHTRITTFWKGITCSVRMRILCAGDGRTKLYILTSL